MLRQSFHRRISRLCAGTVVFVCLLSLLATMCCHAGPQAGGAPGASLDGDAAGRATGTSTDLATAQSRVDPATLSLLHTSGPAVALLAESGGQNRIAINMVWLLASGFLVMFMQAGFALVETGFTRAKNAAHTMMMNFASYFIGVTGFWICGFAFMYGSAGSIANLGGTAPLTGGHIVPAVLIKGSLLATHGFFLAGNTYDVGVYALFLFQVVFMDTAVTLVTGALAERWKFSAFVIYGFFMSMVLYPIFGHWAWGGGWLSQLGNNYGLGCGYVDFAGSGVVHAVGGLCALAGAIVLGPRIGKYNEDGSPNAMPGHDMPMAILGAMILGFGWFGFNPGSTLGAAGDGNLRIGIIAVTTMLASCGGALAAMFYMYGTTRRPDPTMIVNGFLAGLVAITGSSAFVSGSVGFFIGAVAGLLVCLSVSWLDRLRIDDPVGAISVHGVCGLFGVLCVGLFADGTYGRGYNGTIDRATGLPLAPLGLLMGGGPHQLLAQLVGVSALIFWAFGLSYLFFYLCNSLMGIRSKPQDELAGLDVPETGVMAYPSFQVTREDITVLTPRSPDSRR